MEVINARPFDASLPRGECTQQPDKNSFDDAKKWVTTMKEDVKRDTNTPSPDLKH